MGVPFWTDPGEIDPDTMSAFDTRPGAWDIMKVGPQGTILPGIVEVRHKGRKQRMMKATAAGTSGRAETQLGYDPSDIEIDVIMWAAVQWTKFQSLIPVLQPGKLGPSTLTSVSLVDPDQPVSTPPDTSPNAPVIVSHPALQLLRVSSIIVERICPPVPWKGKIDVQVVKMICHEWRKPKVERTKKVTGVSKGLNLAPALVNPTDPATPPSQTAGAP